jgi:hypothetical protein
MIKRADASKINREKATKEQIAENFKRLAVDTDKKVQLKPSLLKIQKTLDGNTFGIIHENKTYYLKYTNKKGSTNPVDFKHLDGLNATFGIEKFNSFDKAINKMSFICEAQNNAHKLRLLLEKDEDITDDSEETKSVEKPVTSDPTEDNLLKDLDKNKASAAAPEAPAPDMGLEPAADMTAEPPAEGGEVAPVDTTQTGTETPKEIAGDILSGIGDSAEAPAEAPAEVPTEEPVDTTAAAPELPAEEPVAPEGGEEAPAEEANPKKDFQETVGKLGQVINELQDKKSLDKKDIKNVMNSIISAIGDDFEQLSDKEKESFYQKIKGSSVSDEEGGEEEVPTEEPVEAPAEEEPSTEKLDENLLRQLKSESKRLLKEQLQKEIMRRKRGFLIENIKRKLV